MFNANNIEAITSIAKEVINLSVLLDWKEESLAEERAIAEEVGAEAPASKLEGASELRETWARLLKACGGDAALAAEVSGITPADIEDYLNF